MENHTPQTMAQLLASKLTKEEILQLLDMLNISDDPLWYAIHKIVVPEFYEDDNDDD